MNNPWIACSERFPEVEDEYLVVLKSKVCPNTTQQHYEYEIKIFDFRVNQLRCGQCGQFKQKWTENKISHLYEITHWMPIPTFP